MENSYVINKSFLIKTKFNPTTLYIYFNFCLSNYANSYGTGKKILRKNNNFNQTYIFIENIYCRYYPQRRICLTIMNMLNYIKVLNTFFLYLVENPFQLNVGHMEAIQS